MNFQESQDHLQSLIRQGIKLGLENTRRMLEYFGNPQLKIPTLHIAGTNGKGSTASFSESILRAAGFRTGLFTSPHLVDFRERIQVDRKCISREEMAHWVSTLKRASEQLNLSPTYFEFSAVLAFLYFESRKTDWNIIEVGMGGRLDSTNLCQGRVCILTSISRDHESSLGTSLPQIAGEKAAIVKHPCTVVCASLEPEVLHVVEQQCQRHQATLLRRERDFHIIPQSQTVHGQVFDYNQREIWYKGLEISMVGGHQAVNAGLAVAACTQLGEPRLTESTLREGLKSAHWPGRIDLMGANPTVILDVAHNPDSLTQLTTTLTDLFPQKRRVWVLGIMKDKPLDEIAEIVSGHADYILATRPRQERSAPPEQIQEALAKYPLPLERIPEIRQAVDRAFQLAAPEDLIVITGSLFTVAEAKQVFENQSYNS